MVLIIYASFGAIVLKARFENGMLWEGGDLMIKSILEQLLDSISLQREKAVEELSKLPTGSLIIRNKRGRKY